MLRNTGMWLFAQPSTTIFVLDFTANFRAHCFESESLRSEIIYDIPVPLLLPLASRLGTFARPSPPELASQTAICKSLLNMTAV